MECTVNASGNISVGNHVISAGSSLAGRRVTVRLDGPVAHILADGTMVRTVACPVPQPARHRHRLRGARAGTAGARYSCLGRSPSGGGCPAGARS
jgi:hypothetical protein